MNFYDIFLQTLITLKSAGTRTILTLLSMAFGVGAVIILTGIGEGARLYVVNEFSSLGSNLIFIVPGRSETTGGQPSVFIGDTPRDLTIEDAIAITKHPNVARIAPIVAGEAPLSYGSRERQAPIMGTTSDFLELRKLKMEQGGFLPKIDPTTAMSVCVIGSSLKKELFGNASPLGQLVRIGDWRYRIIGVISPEGESIGVDLDEIIIVPVASAQMFFNTNSLFRIMVETTNRENIPAVKKHITDTVKKRHYGEEDITIITQDAVLSTFDNIIKILTIAVAGIAGISLVVAGILIMNVMLVSLSQRKTEIGLLKAIGATRQQIVTLFLTESAFLSFYGAILGLILGIGGNTLIMFYYPAFPIKTPFWAIFISIFIGIFTGLTFGILPAIKAAKVDPIKSLYGR